MKFMLDLTWVERFARAYYRDELKAKGLTQIFNCQIDNDYSKRNPKYYNDESQ